MNGQMKKYNRVRSRRVLSAGATMPMELGCITLTAGGNFNQHGSSSKPIV